MTDDALLDHLTDAEREALAEEDLDESPAVEAEDDDDDDEAGQSDAEDQPAQEGKGDSEPDSDGQGKEPVAEQPPSFSIPDVTSINQSIAQLQEAREALETAYEEGDSELTYAEHRAKLREIEKALLDLNAERAEAQAMAKMQQSFQHEWWQREIKSFKRDALKNDGIDYDKDKNLESAWDKAVRFLGSDPDNAQQEAAWFLKEAHEMVKSRFRVGRGTDPAAEKPSALSKVDAALEARRRQYRAPPMTLSGLPEAGHEPEGQGEFSHLDRLSGEALEKALARLSPDQQERYLTA